ncbi:hypothetical protein AKJ16_DCAP03549 [Drosera capensis]
MVDLDSKQNSLRVNRDSRFDFPTPESPMRTTLNRFYANGKHILSAGQDRAFRLFSVIQDQQSRKRAKKLKLSV